MLETIVALATPPMKSALAIIRVSGEETFNIFSKIFTKDLTKIKERTIAYGYIKDCEKLVDEVIVNCYVAPHSFTGENLLEIMCHGSMVIADEIIQALIKNGARMALRGEFSSRAFLNKKIDLIQAEAINEMIDATTKESKDLTLLNLNGKTSKLVYPIKTALADLLSHIEVNIDYPEYQDIEEINLKRIVFEVDRIKSSIHELIKDGKTGQIIKEGIKVAIIGKPNVGKSSLLNSLLKENKAIVTDIAGTTRDIVEGTINFNGIPLHLLDTAGIRASKDVVENIGINKSKTAINLADLIIVVLDANTSIDKEDEEILELVKDKQKIVVYNKSDIKTTTGINISAKNNDIAPLLHEITKVLGIEEKSFITPSLSNARQLGLLTRIDLELDQAKGDALNNLPIDLVSVSLLRAYNGTLELLGETNYNDLSNEIFARFCVGK